jgi:surface antigen
MTDHIDRFLASGPSLEELQGAILAKRIDPRLTAEQRARLLKAEAEAKRK